MYGESEPPDVFTSPTVVNHETPRISREEATTPFVPCPHFPVLMRVPPRNDNEVGKFAHQIPTPTSHSPPAFHNLKPIKEIPKWLMKPMVKTNFESDLDSCPPLSYFCHDPLPHGFID